jgi:hypothetical protein
VVAEQALRDLGLAPAALTIDETNARRDAWRRLYARPLKRELGVWVRGKFDWHVFSFGHTYALERDAARTAYSEQTPKELIVNA